MQNKFHEMMMKKRDMKPSEKHAKLGVLKDLKDSLSDAMSDKMSASPVGMKKVSVMSNSPEGLSAGLDKAKQIANQSSDSDQDQDSDQMMSEGGIAQNSDGTETDDVTYSGTPHDDGFMAPNPNEAYSTGMSMDNNNQSAQDSDEPEHVGYAQGGEVGPNEEMNTEYHGNDFGSRESDSDEVDDVTHSGDASGDDGFKHSNSDETDDVAYAEGGKVNNPMNEAADEVQDEREKTENDAGDDAPPMYKGMKLQEVEEHLQHLLRIKQQMEKQ